AIKGYLTGVADPYLMAKKKDFEKTFRNAVLDKPELKAKYGDPWTDIAKYEEQRFALLEESNALSSAGSQYYSVATRLVAYAENPEGERGGREGRGFGGPRGNVYPANLVPEIEKPLLVDQLRSMRQYLGDKNAAFNKLMGTKTPEQAADYILSTSVVGSKEKFDALVAGKPQDILGSNDPLISFVVQTMPRARELQRTISEISQKQTIKLQSLGRAMYEVYGTSIPPDATFSLRIADGVVKGYDYNGTIAPPVTTFYGLYDRYYSFGKKDPWLLADHWLNPPADFKMSTPMNFVSTNDIIGGNSGSSVINKNLEVVGLIFDGNIESLPGAVIYDDTYNRSVSVHTAGILEGLEKIYKADRLAKELEAGKMVQ
ncbi:MAG TPA: S46 family peptidase, partial [Bacteroidota bacterium]|nr:S46 family peptidase [Bacteroidota bacterium]